MEPRNTPPLPSGETPRAGKPGSVEGSRPEELFAVEGLTPEELVQVYNARRGGLAEAREMSLQRRARLRAFSRRHAKISADDFGAVVEALGRDPWACGTKAGGRSVPLTIDALLRGDFFERQRETLFAGPRRVAPKVGPQAAANTPGRYDDIESVQVET